MKVQIENTGPYEKKISLEIPREVVSQEVESTYQALNRSVKLKGFRPGKVPRSILERYYKAQVESEVITKLIEDSYGKAVEENHLFPVAPPSVLDRTFAPGKEFTCTLTVEVKPEISVEGYLGLEVEKPAVTVTEEEVEAQLKALQETHAQIKPLEADRPVREKDLVIVDFEGTLGGKPLEGWKVKDHLVEVGSQTLVGGLDRQFIGLPLRQDRDLLLTLPDDYPRRELAGKEITVRVQVKELKEKILPSLDDEFAKEVGDFQSLPELKDRLRKDLTGQKEAQATQVAREKLLELLREKHSFAIPKSLIERQTENIIARMELRLARRGVKLEGADLDNQKLRESLLPGAEKEVRSTLILEKVAEKEGITIGEDEMDRKFEQLAVQLKQRVEMVKNYYQKKDRLEDLRAMMREEKTLDFLLGRAKIKEGGTLPEEGK
jgi:trigger factor